MQPPLHWPYLKSARAHAAGGFHPAEQIRHANLLAGRAAGPRSRTKTQKYYCWYAGYASIVISALPGISKALTSQLAMFLYLRPKFILATT